MTVKSTHPEYNLMLERWVFTTNVVDGNVKQMLKTIDPNDAARSTQYKNDAVLANFTARTKHGLVGAAFRKPPEKKILPKSIEYLDEDATGNNRTLEQLAQELVGDILETGRSGLLVDFPSTEGLGDLTIDNVDKLNLNATIVKYNATSITNWNTEQLGGKTVDSLIVLREESLVIQADGFSWETLLQFRVLRLVEGSYVQTLIDESGTIIGMSIPLKRDGSTWDEIPFTFIGADNNDAAVDSIPLEALARLNIAHYKNSADLEESAHITGQGTWVLKTALTIEELKTANPNGLKSGSRCVINPGIDGGLTLIETSPNNFVDKVMQRKEDQARMLGALLIMNSGGVETAEAARIRHSSENSVLAVVVHNVEDALLSSLKFALEFMEDGTGEQELSLKLNMEFFDTKLSPQEVDAHIKLLVSGVTSNEVVRTNMRAGAYIPVDTTDEEIDAAIESDSPDVEIESADDFTED